jgi:pilus assembly protein FimV
VAFNKEKVMDAARKFVDKGQIDKAVKEYLRIVHEDPKDVRVWLKIGDLYAKKGSKQDAIDTYEKVARFYHDQGFFLKAVAVYKQILKLDPRLFDVTLKLAELYRQLGLMSDAMQHFEAVAAHFHREGNTKEALATVKKLVDLDPENIATRIKLAELYSKEGLVEDASTEFQVACEQLRRQGRQDDFIKVAERLLWHKPDNHSLNRELAGLYLRRNDPRRALQKLQACFKHDPRDIETLGLLAQAFQALDQKAKTVSVLKELARVHVENKARDKATEVFRKILEFSPADTDAMQFLGLAPAPAAPPPPTQQMRPSAPPPPPAPTARADADARAGPRAHQRGEVRADR